MFVVFTPQTWVTGLAFTSFQNSTEKRNLEGATKIKSLFTALIAVSAFSVAHAEVKQSNDWSTIRGEGLGVYIEQPRGAHVFGMAGFFNACIELPTTSAFVSTAGKADLINVIKLASLMNANLVSVERIQFAFKV